MAEFCCQCSIALFGQDDRDFAGLVTAEEVAKGIGAEVLCEQCGPTHVDHLGRCVSPYCREHGEART